MTCILRLWMALLLCGVSALSAQPGQAAFEDGPRVAIRLVVVNSYGEGMGRCSLDLKSKYGLQARILVVDSGTSMRRIFPGHWYIEAVRCPQALVVFPEDHAQFDIPDSSADLSLGNLMVEFRSSSISEGISSARTKRKVIAGAAGIAVGGVVGGLAAAEYVDNTKRSIQVEAEADLRVRWNDRNLSTETSAIMGSSNVKRIAIRIDRVH